MQAKGHFEVKIEPLTADNAAARAAGFGRLSLDKHFHGALEATSQGEMLAIGGGPQKDGAYVALERVVGTLDGRKGSFALVHRSLLRDGKPEGWTVAVVPGSGTDALTGIDGDMRIVVEGGEHRYELDYSLPEQVA